MTTATKPAKRPPGPRCGTESGYHAHRRRGESACDPCQLAHREYGREASRRHLATEAGRAANRDRSRRYRATEEGREARREASRRRLATEEGREVAREASRRYLATEEGREVARASSRAALARLRARTPEQASADFQRLRPGGKACLSCGAVLHEEAFHRNWTKPDGRESRCDAHGCRRRHWKLKRDRKLRDHWAAKGIPHDRCLYCLTGPAEDLEHVMPRALGGSDSYENLAPSCAPCNRGLGGKHDRHPLDWLRAAHPDRLDAIVQLFPHIKAVS